MKISSDEWLSIFQTANRLSKYKIDFPDKMMVPKKLKKWKNL